MATHITVDGVAASITDGAWKSEDKYLETMLENYTFLDFPDGFMSADPDPDTTAALALVARLGERVRIVSTEAHAIRSEAVPDRVY